MLALFLLWISAVSSIILRGGQDSGNWEAQNGSLPFQAVEPIRKNTSLALNLHLGIPPLQCDSTSSHLNPSSCRRVYNAMPRGDVVRRFGRHGHQERYDYHLPYRYAARECFPFDGND